MTFDYRDADGDTFIVANNKTDAGQPVVWMATSPDGVYIVLNRVEEVVAGIRDAARTAARTAARQTTGQDDTEPLPPRADRCPEPECAEGRECWRCDYEESQHAARRAAPAVGQPAEAHDTDARPPRVQWLVEGYDADQWNPCTGRLQTREAALRGQESLQRRYPDMPTRIVRETTTSTVEDER